MRRAARLVIADGRGRLLLVRYRRQNGEAFWATPGGGLEAGESFEDAAVREAREEIGIADARVTRLWSDVVEYPSGREQQEVYFLVDNPRVDLDSSAKARRDEGILEVRWWQTREIEMAAEPVYPEGLLESLRRGAETRHLFAPSE